MDILGIGPLELLFIFVIVLIVLGPRDMVKTGQQIGNFLGNLMRSDFWKALQTAQREVRTLPNRLARESGLRELDEQLRAEGKKIERIQNETDKEFGEPVRLQEEGLKTEGWTTPSEEDASDANEQPDAKPAGDSEDAA